MEAFIHFIIKYNEKIIYILGGAICFFSALVVWWQVFGKKGLKIEGAVDIDLSGIEESLKKILGQTNAAIGSVAGVSVAGGGAEGVSLTGVTSLDGKPIVDTVGVKKELETRAKIIDDLRLEVKEAKSQDASAELLAKIKALEGRLAEYEIIEDDIADLSVLKEENAKLKKELEGIKRASPQMVDQFAAEMAVAEAKSGVANKAADLQVKQAKVEDPMLAAVEAAQAELHDKGDGVVVASAVATETATATEVAPLAGAAVNTDSVAADAVTAPKDDIFGEFSQNENQSEDPLAALGDIDPDKMLEELKDFNLEESAGSETLDEAPDVDKIAQEATAFDLKKG